MFSNEEKRNHDLAEWKNALGNDFAVDSERCISGLENTEEMGKNVSRPNEVIRGWLWIGCALGAEFIDRIENLGAIVSLSSARDRAYRYPPPCKSVRRHHVEIEDSPQADMLQHIKETARFMHETICAEKAVYVHCQAGLSRSVTIVMAYLIRYQRVSLCQAYMIIKCARPIACPNGAFCRQLREWEAAVLKEEQTMEAKNLADESFFTSTFGLSELQGC